MDYPDLFDDDGYPTDDALNRLEHWLPVQGETHTAINAALDYARALWSDYGTVSEDLQPAERALLHAEATERFLRFATGGWSGNESVIAALNANCLLCTFTWRLNAAGGLHIYRYLNPV